MLLGILFIFGLLFGSFASVVITRLKSGKKGTLSGRSQCPHCEYILGWKDLIPLFSWIFQKGKCRYCHAKIPVIYPLLELTMGAVFSLVGYFLIDTQGIYTFDTLEWMKMIFWLFFAFLTMIYVWYDILYLEIPEGILLVLIALVFSGLSLATLWGEVGLFPYKISKIEGTLGVTIFSIVSGLILIAGLYAILWGEFSEIVDLGILMLLGIGIYTLFVWGGDRVFLNAFWGAWGVFLFFFLQIFVSGGKWMGGGDLRIAILLGLVSGPLTVIATISAYISGSVIGIGILTILRLQGQKNLRNTKIPFGPFLAIGIFSALFWGETLHALFFPFSQ